MADTGSNCFFRQDSAPARAQPKRSVVANAQAKAQQQKTQAQAEAQVKRQQKVENEKKKENDKQKKARKLATGQNTISSCLEEDQAHRDSMLEREQAPSSPVEEIPGHTGSQGNVLKHR